MMSFPFRKQLESMDCGPACIQMIAAYYGKEIPLSLLKEYTQVTRLGASIHDIMSGCKKIGMESSVVRVAKNEVSRMPLPAILYWRQEHYVVLYKIAKRKKENQYYIADPDFGKARMAESDFLKNWQSGNDSGIACIMEPTDNFSQLDFQSPGFKESLKTSLKPFKRLTFCWKNLLVALLFSLITFGCTWLIPFILQRIIDDGIGNKDASLILLMLVGQLGLFVGSTLSSFFSNNILFRVGLKVGLSISTDYIYKLVRLPISFFDTKVGTDLLQRLNDENKIRDFLTYILNNIVVAVLNVVVYSSVLLYYEIRAFFVFLFFTCVVFLLARITLKTRKLLNYTLFTSFSDKRNIEYELINGMMEIKTNTAQNLFLQKWEKVQHKINDIQIKNLYIEYFLSSGTTLTNVLRDIIITGGCAYLVIQGNLTLGVMMTITYILGHLSGTVTQTTLFVKSFQDSQIAYERIEEVQKIPEEDVDKLMRIPKELVFGDGFLLEHLSFKYAGSHSPYVLNDINAQIPLHQVTAIVGASGSGKTTLLKLLLSFYYPQKGNLLLNGSKISSFHSAEWHQRCGVVMQDGLIFSDTIAGNIALADEKPDLDKLRIAAKIACIDDFIDQLPMKYNTKIGNSGLGLSGGQRQRILIARAVYRNPEFVFLDEATSSLDANNELQIMNNLKKFYQGRTVVIIAHRLSTVREADNILVLDKGHLVEQGNHKVLSEKRGLYYHLIKNQLELGV